jgi:hypothetical protein
LAAAGLYAKAYGASTGAKYGIYAEAAGTGTLWAGYFAAGDVYINDFLGIGGTPSYPFHITDTSGSNDKAGYIGYTPSSATNTYALQIVATPSSGSTTKAFGIHSKAYKTTASSQGRSYGIVGYAGNCTNGYNYGVLGQIGGSNYGISICGVERGGSVPASTSADYAGYFVGDVKITGELQGARLLILYGHSSASSSSRYLKGVNGTTVDSTRGFVMPRSGSIVSYSLGLYVTSAGVSSTSQPRLYVDTTLKWSGNTVDTTSLGWKESRGTAARGTYTFTAGQTVKMYEYKSGSSNATTDDLFGIIEVVFDD